MSYRERVDLISDVLAILQCIVEISRFRAVKESVFYGFLMGAVDIVRHLRERDTAGPLLPSRLSIVHG